MWGARLTHNFARKGGYWGKCNIQCSSDSRILHVEHTHAIPIGEEDYRWAIVRRFFERTDPLHPLFREVFSFVFVALYQTLLIWSFSALPLWKVSQFQTPFSVWDFALACIAVAAIAGEKWADDVQFAFQTAKHKMSASERSAAGGDFSRGFCTQGPFRFSRHLNFMCEQSFWVCIYGFTVLAGAPVVNIGGVGCAALILLFQGSTWFTEKISCGKYLDYCTYQLTTSRLIPWFSGPELDSIEGQRLARKTREVKAFRK